MRKEDFIHIVCTVYLLSLGNARIIQVYNVASTFCWRKYDVTRIVKCFSTTREFVFLQKKDRIATILIFCGIIVVAKLYSFLDWSYLMNVTAILAEIDDKHFHAHQMSRKVLIHWEMTINDFYNHLFEWMETNLMF